MRSECPEGHTRKYTIKCNTPIIAIVWVRLRSRLKSGLELGLNLCLGLQLGLKLWLKLVLIPGPFAQ